MSQSPVENETFEETDSPRSNEATRTTKKYRKPFVLVTTVCLLSVLAISVFFSLWISEMNSRQSLKVDLSRRIHKLQNQLTDATKAWDYWESKYLQANASIFPDWKVGNCVSLGSNGQDVNPASCNSNAYAVIVSKVSSYYDCPYFTDYNSTFLSLIHI